ncbi:hypothetical protein BDV97DRAFT_204183 [Delphinella strobiligena]|nr:hypothetical protein BDV97DRAFT_204183 [Delphinella strobiligena]
MAQCLAAAMPLAWTESVVLPWRHTQRRDLVEANEKAQLCPGVTLHVQRCIISATVRTRRNVCMSILAPYCHPLKPFLPRSSPDKRHYPSLPLLHSMRYGGRKPLNLTSNSRLCGKQYR